MRVTEAPALRCFVQRFERHRSGKFREREQIRRRRETFEIALHAARGEQRERVVIARVRRRKRGAIGPDRSRRDRRAGQPHAREEHVHGQSRNASVARGERADALEAFLEHREPEKARRRRRRPVAGPVDESGDLGDDEGRRHRHDAAANGPRVVRAPGTRRRGTIDQRQAFGGARVQLPDLGDRDQRAGRPRPLALHPGRGTAVSPNGQVIAKGAVARHDSLL